MRSIIGAIRTPDAVAEVFALAFNALTNVEQQAVLKRRREVAAPNTKLVVQPATTLRDLCGLVAWGGDALEDSERLYDL
jgi:hypothetical protein